MNNYYLVARDKKNNEIKVFLLDEKWYLDQYGEGVYLNNSLEAIDMVTSKYSNFKEMNEALFGLEVEDYNDIDVFVVNFDKKGKGLFDEVIFNPTHASNYRTVLLNKVALANMAGEKRNGYLSLQKIVNDFLLTIYSAEDFYSMVVSGDISICPSIVDVCKRIVELDDFSGNFLPGDNFCNNYRSIRNMVEALYRLETLAGNNKTDRIIANQERYLEKKTERDRVLKQIGYAIENPYGDDLVYSLDSGSFSDKARGSDSDYNRKMRARSLNHKLQREEEKKKESLERKRQEKKESIDLGCSDVVSDFDTVSDDVKRAEVRRVLNKLPVNVFVKDKESDAWIINKSILNCEISEEDEVKLNTLLTGNMPLFFLKYAYSKQAYRDAKENEFNLLEYDQEVGYNMKVIETRFKSSTCLSKTYNWCMIYAKYMKLSAENTSGGDSFSERGKIFEKK